MHAATEAQPAIIEKRRAIVRVDGSIEYFEKPITNRQISITIGARTLDSVQLKSWGSGAWQMVVDDTGMVDGRPVNEIATDLYLKQCAGGSPYSIHGDVVIVPDADFA